MERTRKLTILTVRNNLPPPPMTFQSQSVTHRQHKAKELCMHIGKRLHQKYLADIQTNKTKHCQKATFGDTNTAHLQIFQAKVHQVSC